MKLYQKQIDKSKYKETRKIYRRTNSKKCSEQTKTWRLKHKEKVREYHKKSIRTLNARFRNSRKNAGNRHKEWALTIEQYKLITNLPCYYCGGYFGKVETGSGLDRLDNNIGYTITNIVSCCYTCNKIKNDTLTVSETKEVIKVIINMR